jgi:hypothetical protein
MRRGDLLLSLVLVLTTAARLEAGIDRIDLRVEGMT